MGERETCHETSAQICRWMRRCQHLTRYPNPPPFSTTLTIECVLSYYRMCSLRHVCWMRRCQHLTRYPTPPPFSTTASSSFYTYIPILYTLYSIPYTLYPILYTLYSIHYTLYPILYTPYSITYTLYPILYTLQPLPPSFTLRSPFIFLVSECL